MVLTNRLLKELCIVFVVDDINPPDNLRISKDMKLSRHIRHRRQACLYSNKKYVSSAEIVKRKLIWY